MDIISEIDGYVEECPYCEVSLEDVRNMEKTMDMITVELVCPKCRKSFEQVYMAEKILEVKY